MLSSEFEDYFFFIFHNGYQNIVFKCIISCPLLIILNPPGTNRAYCSKGYSLSLCHVKKQVTIIIQIVHNMILHCRVLHYAPFRPD